MKQSMNKLKAKVMPYIGMGLFLILFLLGLVVFSYILIIGAIVGLILFLIAYIRSKFTRHHPHSQNDQSYKNKPQGRVIDHNDIK